MPVAKEKNITALSLGKELHVPKLRACVPKGFTKFIAGLMIGLDRKGNDNESNLPTTIAIKHENIVIITPLRLSLNLSLFWNQKNHRMQTSITAFIKLLSTINTIKESKASDLCANLFR